MRGVFPENLKHRLVIFGDLFLRYSKNCNRARSSLSICQSQSPVIISLWQIHQVSWYDIVIWKLFPVGTQCSTVYYHK